MAKNFVLLTAGLVIAGYEITPREQKRITTADVRAKNRVSDY